MAWSDIFDIHSHIGYYAGKEYPAAAALDRMDRNGIQRAVICSFVTGLIDRDDFRRANDYVIAAVRAHPDRFVGMCALTPVHGNAAVDELRRCLSQGLSGVKLHPDKHGLYSLAGPAMAALMREVEASGAVVFTHADFNSKVCNPHEVVLLARAFPKVRIIMGHFGLDQDLVGRVPAIVEPVPNLFLDTSQTVDHPEAVFVTPTTRLGRHRVLFGSDAPVISPEVNLKKLEVAVELFGLTPEVVRAILWDNALQLLSGVPNVRV
jgi:predicted TIM-barrel fold metal-dependent hydrolase